MYKRQEEYKADVKAKIKEQKAADGKRNQEDQAVEQAVKNAEYEIPQPMIDTQTTQMVEDFAQRIQSQGITLEPVSYTHLDVYKRQWRNLLG